VEIGIASLSDTQLVPETGKLYPAGRRHEDIVDYAVLAERLGLDLFGLGEHHSVDFAVSSPAIVLAAIAARTSTIRLASAVTVLSVLDPVRVYQDFATLDLISKGRAEIVAGRSAFAEPFALFGVDTAGYDAVFAEKLDLLLKLRQKDRLSWKGRFRPPITDSAITPRAQQDPLPVWLGVGGSPGSAQRAGLLGLPMMLGLIGGSIADARHAIDIYREAGKQAGHADKLSVGIATHVFAAERSAAAREVYPYYREFLRPKRPGGSGFVVGQAQFTAGIAPGNALMIGTSEEIVSKILEARKVLGVDRVLGLVDWGGLPRVMVEESITRFATEVAPAVRSTLGVTVGDARG
jgi:alkanesulfonate monooxygenase SsuD/methylene tetrahydromethanopterin reductase-like flavin-dependent oxidoreductase (luciferase family)